MSGEADELIVLETPEPFWAIGESYANYSPTSDETVIACLVRAADRAVSTRDASAGVAKES
jgi:putative phosphoribosyl transferase